MLPDRVSNPGPLTYESGALPIALRAPALCFSKGCCSSKSVTHVKEEFAPGGAILSLKS